MKPWNRSHLVRFSTIFSWRNSITAFQLALMLSVPATAQEEPPSTVPLQETESQACSLNKLEPTHSIHLIPGHEPDLQQGRLRIQLRTKVPTAGSVNISGQVVTDHGEALFELTDMLRIQAGSSSSETELSIALSRLPLPQDEPFDRAQITLDAEIRSADGSPSVIKELLVVRLDREQTSWRIYDPNLPESAPLVFTEAILETAEGRRSTKAEKVIAIVSEPDPSDTAHPAASFPDAEGPFLERLSSTAGDTTPRASQYRKICFEVSVPYLDTGHGNPGPNDDKFPIEDFETTKFGPRPMRYASYSALPFYFGHLDGSGCFSGSFPNDFPLVFFLNTRGVRGGNRFSVHRESTDETASISLPLTFKEGDPYLKHVVLYTSQQNRWAAYTIVAQGFFRAHGGHDNIDLKVLTNAEGGSRAGLRWPKPDKMYLNGNFAQRKFAVGHELGHIIGGRATGNAISASLTSGDCSYSDDSAGVGGDPPCWLSDPDDSSNHGMRSLEYAGCAIKEGWAHFYSAMLWNQKDFDGAFIYWDPAQTSYSLERRKPNKSSLVDECVAADEPKKFGVEEDWMRLFWDVWTQAKLNGANPTHIQMLDWIDDSSSKHSCPDFDDLHGEANQVGGALNANWDNTWHWNAAHYGKTCS